jgi:ethanolamine utilization protein EutN
MPETSRKPGAHLVRCAAAASALHYGDAMLIARVMGSAVSTAKDPSLTGFKLLLVREADESGENVGPVFVAVDGAGAGAGELVLVARGSAARFGATTRDKPVDALVVGVLDSMDVEGTVTFRKT